MSSRIESSHIQKLNGFPGIFSLKKTWRRFNEYSSDIKTSHEILVDKTERMQHRT